MLFWNHFKATSIFFTLPIVCDEKIKFVDLKIWLLTQTSTSHRKQIFSPILCRGRSSVFASPLLGSAISLFIVMRIHRCISAYRAHRLYIGFPVSSIVHTDSIKNYLFCFLRQCACTGTWLPEGSISSLKIDAPESYSSIPAAIE